MNNPEKLSRLSRIFGNSNVHINQVSGLNGESVTITNGQVLINGMTIEEYEKQQHCKVIINVTVEGNCDKITNCDEVIVNGDCNTISTVNGDIKCNAVNGNVSTLNGDVTCKEISGSVSTINGNIHEH